jgi:MFS transporter, OFA family, oxalate/formate antiporter
VHESSVDFRADTRTAAGKWALFAVISAIFFLITGATFSSLGVVLPSMIAEMSWTWSQAGAGFSLFALTVGLASTVPAWILRRLGIKATYGIGGLVMTLGFCLLALTHNLHQYLFAAAMLGLGFASCATVPAVYLLTGWMPERRSAAIGAYMTIGGLGAVAGPIVANRILTVAHSWRAHWWAMGAAMLALTALALLFVKHPPAERADGEEPKALAHERNAERVYQTAADWRFRDAIRTPHYWVISAAMTATLLCVLTANSWAVTHMGKLGFRAAVAAGVLSAAGAVSALSRALGGLLATRVDPKWLLVSALAGEAVSMAALSVAGNWVAITIFFVAEGFGFGMCLFATAVLLVNYFGAAANPEIYGTFNLITTAAMVGPVAGGMAADRFGGFAGVFQACSVGLLLVVLLAALMRPPRVHPDKRPA